MKRYIIFICFIILTIVLTGCGIYSNNDDSESVSNDQGSEIKEDLQLQVLEIDKREGLTIDNNELYEELNRIVTENPKLGEANDFSMHAIQTANEGQQNATLIFLAINRTGNDLKNVSFLFSLGNTNGDMILENEPVNLIEEDAGVIENNAAIPIYFAINEVQTEMIKALEQRDSVVKFENFEYDILN